MNDGKSIIIVALNVLALKLDLLKSNYGQSKVVFSKNLYLLYNRLQLKRVLTALMRVDSASETRTKTSASRQWLLIS